ncbi:Putative helicase [Olavius sp. associated proteobacterium Delta 1]|nr:Putative helicase [Olavius sp. associated proteobacterium Delta 1]
MDYQDFKDSYFDVMNVAERMFIEEIYYPLLGKEALDYVRPQMPFRDSKNKLRQIDFAVVTSNAKYAVEIDGYQYHAEGAIAPDEFSDQLYRQNELTLADWKVLRFSWDHLNYEKEIVADALLRALRADDLLHPSIKKRGEIPVPHYAQNRALAAIEYYRNAGRKKGIAVLATGLGKTFLAAFDAKRFDGKTLFIVHKNEILQQAKESFELVWPEATTSYFNAEEKELGTRVVFASKDTLCRPEYLKDIPQDLFDYIIVDEVHHGQCDTYLRIFRHFEPQFSLGLTATPDRMDRKDIFELYDYNLIYQMGQKEAIESGYLAGFKYYGLTDDIDYSKARHNGRRYNVHDLDRLLIIDERNEAIYDRYMELCPNKKAIGFCVSINHADRMAEYFNSQGIKAEAVHSSLTKAMREEYIEKFRENGLTILFTCDLFNEGVDFPDVEALLFLRPTESRTIFTQQMGRGLRLSKGKHYVIVLDFIGNFKKANHVRGFLEFEGENDKKDPKKRGVKDEYEWPLGCEVHFDEDLIEMFKEMDDLEEGPTKEKLIEQYFSIKDELGRKPKPSDINELGRFTISAYNKLFGTWVAFLREIGEATKASYHYHQGVHLGHLFFVVHEVGSGNFDGYLEKEKIFPSEGTLTKFGRQIRYKIWAAMEIGLLEDDRKPGASELTYQNLTENGKVLYEALQKHQDKMPSDFFEFRTDLKTEHSWATIQNEQFYNKFFRDVLCSDPTDKIKLLNIFLGFMGIKHMCKYLFHVSQSKVVNRTDLYNNYFQTPFIESYFEMHGIVQDSVAGAARRLPFLVNILEACGVVSFVNRSKFQLEKLPMIPVLFSEDMEDTAGAEAFIGFVKAFYGGSAEADDFKPEVVVQLRTWFGKDFLTEKYFVSEILNVDGAS